MGDALEDPKAAKAAIKAGTADEVTMIALAYAHRDGAVRKAARAWVAAHVAEAAALEGLGTKTLAGMEAGKACALLRAVAYPRRGALAVAMIARGANVQGVALEEDPEFARRYIYTLLRPDEGSLYLTQAPPPKGKDSYFPEYVALSRFPDVVFDELAGLRAQLAFDTVVVHGGGLTELPPAFVQLAPFLRKLVLAYTELPAFPEVIAACTNLEELHLIDQPFATLPASFAKLAKLRVLWLHTMKAMKTLPPVVCELPALEELDLGFATMKTLPAALASAPKLAKLSLQSSQVAKLPPELDGKPGLAINKRWSKLPDAT